MLSSLKRNLTKTSHSFVSRERTPVLLKNNEQKTVMKSSKMDLSEDECISPSGDFPISPHPPEKDAVQVMKLLSIPKVEQRTPEWYATRTSMITASDWAAAIGEGCSGKPKDVILKKCDQGVKFTGNEFTEWGTKYEAVATRLYELRKKTLVYEFGVLRHPKYFFLGASPDGITPNGVMLEIKCPYRRKITGIIPRYYWIQMQGQLEVCDLEICDFLECKINEYPSMDVYLKDTSSSPVENFSHLSPELRAKHRSGDVFLLTEDGYEKGAVITYLTSSGDKKYFYSELGVSKREFKRWESQVEKEANKRWTKMRVTFFRFDHFSCVRVQRDRRWFEEAAPKLTELWNQVEHYRNVGCESLLKKKKKISLIQEPSLQEIQATVQNTAGLDDMALAFLAEVQQKPRVIAKKPVKESAKEPVKESKVQEDEVIMETTRIPSGVPVTSSPDDHISFEYLEAISDIEVQSLFLPRFIPLAIRDQRDILAAEISLAGLAKCCQRIKTAISRLVRQEDFSLERFPDTQEHIRRISIWIEGLPRMLDDYLHDYSDYLSQEGIESIKKTKETSIKLVKLCSKSLSNLAKFDNGVSESYLEDIPECLENIQPLEISDLSEVNDIPLDSPVTPELTLEEMEGCSEKQLQEKRTRKKQLKYTFAELNQYAFTG